MCKDRLRPVQYVLNYYPLLSRNVILSLSGFLFVYFRLSHRLLLMRMTGFSVRSFFEISGHEATENRKDKTTFFCTVNRGCGFHNRI